MQLDGATFWHAYLRSLLSELGDKTFFLTIVLAAWCPWEGIRGSGDRLLQLCLVFAGAFLALALHAVQFLTAEPSASGRWTCTCEVLTCLFLFVLGAKAKLELGRVDANGQQSSGQQAVSANPFKEPLPPGTMPAGGKWNERAFGALTAPLASSTECEERPAAVYGPCACIPTGGKWNEKAFGALMAPWVVSMEREEQPSAVYGSFSPPMTSAHGVFSERISDKLVSHILAFVATLTLVFMAEAEDKSQDAFGTLPAKTSPDTDVIAGAVLGFLPATALAVFLGFILERQLSDQRMLFFVTCVLLGLSLVAFSQALVHTGAATPSLPATAHQAFLALITLMHPQSDIA